MIHSLFFVGWYVRKVWEMKLLAFDIDDLNSFFEDLSYLWTNTSHPYYFSVRNTVRILVPDEICNSLIIRRAKQCKTINDELMIFHCPRIFNEMDTEMSWESKWVIFKEKSYHRVEGSFGIRWESLTEWKLLCGDLQCLLGRVRLLPRRKIHRHVLSGCWGRNQEWEREEEILIS